MATLVTTADLTLNDSYGTLGCDLYGSLVGKYQSFEGNFCHHLQCNYHQDGGQHVPHKYKNLSTKLNGVTTQQ